MLKTNLKHLESKEALTEACENNKYVMICCGRMGPMCIPVYGIMEALEEGCPQIKFFDQDFDGSAARYIKGLPECKGFRGLPFTVYFKDAKVVAATTSIQTKEEVVAILNREFVESE